MANKKASDKHEKSVLEKRLHPRHTLRTQVIFEDESGEGFIYFYSTDISLGGVFLSFSLSNGERPIRTIGRVVRVEKETAEALYAIGMGVQFVDLPDSSRELIQNYVQP